MSQAAWIARRFQAKDARIRNLRDKVRGYCVQIHTTQEKINSLTSELAKQLHKHTTQHHLQSPADQIVMDIIENRERAPNGRRYSLDTLHWAWTIH
jgi:hypothetical protein